MMVMMVMQWCWVMTKMMMMIIIMMRMMMVKKNTGLRANPLNGFQLRFAGQKTM